MQVNDIMNMGETWRPSSIHTLSFRVCKSVHHHPFKWTNQPDAAISQVYYLSFKHSSTCFGHPHAHHQELNNCSSSLWFYRWSVVIAVLLVVVGPSFRPNGLSVTGRPARPRPTALLLPRSNGKPEATTAIYKLLMMGKRMSETCSAVFERQAINLRDWCIWLFDLFECRSVFKRQVINLRNCCIWLVDSFECMMMHGLANPKWTTTRRSSSLQPIATTTTVTLLVMQSP